MYTIIQHVIHHDFAIVSKEKYCYYNDGIWSSSIKKLLQSPIVTKEYFNKYDAICIYPDFNQYLKELNFTIVIDIPVLDYEYIKTNYPELLI